MRAQSYILATAAMFSLCATVQAEGTGGLTVQMNLVNENGIGQPIGEVTIHDTQYGAVFTPSLTGLPPGIHGFHVHENPSCEPAMQNGKPVAALAAGGHYDPARTGRHGLPWGDGHLGDLPALFVNAEGNATYPVLAPRFKLAEVRGRSLMVHVGGDNHADQPAPLGGGGARIACGVIQ